MGDGVPALPRYTLYNVFQHVGRNDLIQCSRVSKLWHEVASTTKSGWSIIDAVTLFPKREFINSDVFGPQRYQGKSIPFHRALSEDDSWNFAGSVNFYSDSGEVIAGPLSVCGTCEFSLITQNRNAASKCLVAIIQGVQEHSALWRCELIEYPKTKKQSVVTHAVVLEVNIPELERLTEAGQKIYWVDKIAESATKFNAKRITKMISDISSTGVRIPLKPVIPQKQPNGLSVSLFKYQLDVVNWMKSVEEDASYGFDFTTLIPWHERNTNILFDPYSRRTVPVRDVGNHTKHVNPRGGILADEMGLGKTTEIISLILANPGDPTLLAPPGGYAGNHAGFMGNHRLTNTDADRFNTNATLVLCPSHLLKQWHEEIEKNTKLPLNVVFLSNIHDIRNCTYGDIISADVVLVAHQMIINKNYFSIGSTKKLTGPRDYGAIRERDHEVSDYLERIWNSGNVLTCKAPVFEHFNWRRIVVDEGHEIINKESYQAFFIDFHAHYWWYVTGTPFPNDDAKKKLIEFLRFPGRSDDIMTWAFIDIYINNLFWRNTKESVKGEYEVPPIVEDLRLLNFTAIEKAIYDDFALCFADEISEVCCTPTICRVCDDMFGERPSLSEIRASYITSVKARIEEWKIKIKEFEDSLVTYEEELVLNRDTAVEKKVARDEQAEKEQGRSTRSELMKAADKRFKKATQQVVSAENKIKTANKKITECKDNLEYTTKLLQRLHEMDPSSYSGPDMTEAMVIPLPSLKQEEGEPINNAETNLPVEADNPAPTKEQKSDTPTWSKILSMSAPELKAELSKRGVKGTSKLKKAELQQALKQAVKADTSTTNSDEQEGANEDKKTKGKRSRSSKANEDDDSGITTKKPRASKKTESKYGATPVAKTTSCKKRTVQDKIDEQNLLKWLVEKEGTKLANLMIYLKQLWEENPAAKFSKLLGKISTLLEEKDINYGFLEGNAMKRNKKLAAFKSQEAGVHVLLLNINHAASGTNIIEASHIILMDPILTEEAQTTEAQAIARAHRQGQTKHVTVTRFIARETKEYEAYTQNYGKSSLSKDAPIDEHAASGRPKLQRTSSLVTALATTPSQLRTSSTLSELSQYSSLQ